MLNYLMNLIFPPKCIFCGQLLDIGSGINICGTCYREIPFSNLTHWVSIHETPSGEYCDGIIWVCEYTGIIKEALRKYKFGSKSSYYKAFGKLLSEKVKIMTNFCKFDIIISVPLHKDRENTRGYNQSYLISRVLSRELGIPEWSQLLSRIKNTSSQSLLGKNDRHANIQDAFRVSYPSAIKGKTVLLIDDIITTGSTIAECSKVLKDAGARHVAGAVISSGRKLRNQFKV